MFKIMGSKVTTFLAITNAKLGEWITGKTECISVTMSLGLAM